MNVRATFSPLSDFNALTWRDETHALLEAHGAEVIWSSNPDAVLFNQSFDGVEVLFELRHVEPSSSLLVLSMLAWELIPNEVNQVFTSEVAFTLGRQARKDEGFLDLEWQYDDECVPSMWSLDEMLPMERTPWLPALERALNRLALLHRTLAPFVEASQEGRFDLEAARAMLKQLQSNLEAL